MRTFAKDSIRR